MAGDQSQGSQRVHTCVGTNHRGSSGYISLGLRPQPPRQGSTCLTPSRLQGHGPLQHGPLRPYYAAILSLDNSIRPPTLYGCHVPVSSHKLMTGGAPARW
eukprot:823148-Pyramimonas_sp.AAC.1